MLAANEDAVLADMAETYGIFDTWEESPLPLERYASLAAYLRDNSRIKLILADTPIDSQTTMLAAIFDAVNWLKWSRSVDGEKNVNRPSSVLESLMRKPEKKEYENGREIKDGRVVFESPEAFEQEFERLRQLKKGT